MCPRPSSLLDPKSRRSNTYRYVSVCCPFSLLEINQEGSKISPRLPKINLRHLQRRQQEIGTSFSKIRSITASTGNIASCSAALAPSPLTTARLNSAHGTSHTLNGTHLAQPCEHPHASFFSGRWCLAWQCVSRFYANRLKR